MSTKNSSAAVVSALSHLLADSYTLYLKTQNYHWNVTGPQFAALHGLFQAQYEDLITANDDIAERIRALGEKAPGSFTAFMKLSKIREETGAPAWKDMLKNLSADQEKIAATAQEALKLAEDVGDEPTVDLMINRIAQHQKNKWMLDAHLE
jgi:starvation-inducible DNA-binding protein